MANELRTLRVAPDPLGNFIRPGYNDHTVLAKALVEGRGSGSGLVINPVHADRQIPLVEAAREAGVETILDCKSLELSQPGGYASSGITRLPWADESERHSPRSLAGSPGTDLILKLSDYVVDKQFSAVLAPTHLLDDPGSMWWEVDASLTHQLRRTLNDRGRTDTLIYYPVIARTTDIFNPVATEKLVEHLRRLPIDAVWLKIHPFGTTNSGPLVLKRYLQFCRALHQLELPIVAEQSGSIGVALLAFGAVGGIESGVTFGDTVNLSSTLATPKPDAKPFSLSPRVYLHRLGAFLDAKSANDFFANRGIKALHTCVDSSCCRRGLTDMVASPREHFMKQRAIEVAQLSAMPSSLRPGFYLEKFLRPASDHAMRAAELEPSLAPVRKRLEHWRVTLGADIEQQSDFTVSKPAAGRRLRRSA